MHLQSFPCQTSLILNLQIQLAKHVGFGAKLGLHRTLGQIAKLKCNYYIITMDQIAKLEICKYLI